MARKKRASKKIRSRGFRLSLKKETLISILQVGCLALAGLIIVSFSRQGALLIRLNDWLVGQVGWAAILLPFILISLGFLISKLKIPLGQPNVIVGILLFFVSVTTLTKAGRIGNEFWNGFTTLLTAPGAFVVLVATSLIGLVILFNTSFDQVLVLLGAFLRQMRKYLVGEPRGGLVKTQQGFASPKKGLKVLGGLANSSLMIKKPAEVATSKDEPLASKLVSNIPGEEAVWKYPPISLLPPTESGKADRGDIKGNAALIEQTLESFGITARVVEVNLGPAVTQYAIEVALGTKLSKITSLDRDLARALESPTGAIRIEAPIPGRSLVGIELPNRAPEFVPFRKMIASDEMRSNPSKLAVALGLDVAGKPVVADIGRMPHVLIAGQTGSGKSVCLNAFLASILFRASPSEVKLILVDPKRVELTGYNDIPHMLSPVIVEPGKVISALRWTMGEMDRRYKLFAEAGVRNITGYNEMSGFQALPYIILVIDELADIMLFSPVEVEDAITRIAQMSRATGIHMILATQRPSVDVITGLIKANIPCRVAFAVASQVDSRVIMDMPGAEKLLGKGDMLYLSPDQAKPARIQGAFLGDKDIQALVSFLKNQGIPVQYTEEVVNMPRAGSTVVAGVEGETDDLFREAVDLVCQFDKASASLLQRRLKIGYARAARVIDQLESAGVIGPADGAKPREVLIQGPQDIFGSSEEVPAS